MKKLILALAVILALSGCASKKPPTEYVKITEGKTTYRYDETTELSYKAAARIDSAMNYDEKRSYTVIYHFYYDDQGVFLKGEMEYKLDDSIDSYEFVNKVLSQTSFKKVAVSTDHTVLVRDKKFTYYSTLSYEECIAAFAASDIYKEVTVVFTEAGREAYFNKYVLKQG